MGERDTYQIVLQLKDEISTNLRTINGHLDESKKYTRETIKEVSQLEGSFRKSVAPIRDFAFQLRNIMGIAGLAVIIRNIVSGVASLEKAYLLANPAMANAAGSASMFGKAIDSIQARIGGVINNALSPLREWFVNFIDPMLAATEQLKQFTAEYATFMQKYGTPKTKAEIAYEEAQTKQIEKEKQLVELGRQREVTQQKLIANYLAAQEPYMGRISVLMEAGYTKEAAVAALAKQRPAPILETAPLDVFDKMIEGIKKELADLAVWMTENPASPVSKKPGADLGLTGFPIPSWAGEQIAGNEPIVVTAIEELAKAQVAADYKRSTEFTKQETLLRQQVLDSAKQTQDLITAQEVNADKIVDATKTLAQARSDIAKAKLLFTNPQAAFSSLMEETAAPAVTGFASAAGIVGLMMALEEVFAGIIEIVGPSINGIWKPFKETFDLIGNTIGTLVLPVTAELEKIFGKVYEAAKPLIAFMSTILEPMFIILGKIVELFGGLIDGITAFFNKIWEALQSLVSWIPNLPSMANPEWTNEKAIAEYENWNKAVAEGTTSIGWDQWSAEHGRVMHSGGIATDETIAILRKGERVINPYMNTAYTVGGNGAGNIIINAPNARYLDANTAAELVRMGLVAMRA